MSERIADYFHQQLGSVVRLQPGDVVRIPPVTAQWDGRAWRWA
jgi:hypothetical protein